MYRAKRLFEKQGFQVIPYKADYKSERNKITTIIDFLPSADYLKNTEIGFRELVGRFYCFYKS
jgi:uncharacterized SAM-binding protein YcdF (DUF218 family)